MPPAAPDPIARFHRDLRGWYARHGRSHLPWRANPTPYAIYVSEVMLQQTQVKTVLERFYFPFLERFPTLETLAAASRKEVLTAWQGLGYYRRAINLHEAAKTCRGKLPETIEGLMALPGVGRNTAHAVAAFAYGQKAAVMEANVRRVLARMFALTHPSDSELWDKAGQLLDKRHAFDYNQAMMDLGALVCRKTSPRCGECPAAGACLGKESPESYPAPKVKKTVPVRNKQIVVFCNRKGEYFAQPRPGNFLGGLYHFVEADSSAQSVNFQNRRYALAKGRTLGHIRQSYSHFTLEGTVRVIEGAAGKGPWYSPSELKQLPMSMAERKVLALLEVA